MNQLTTMSAAALAAAIRRKDVSASEVVSAHLARIKAVNGRLNAVAVLAESEALAQARLADQAVAHGAELGPLHGVPVTIKDAYDVAGMVSTGGTKGRASFCPEKDATVVARLRNAGAIILGKTNVPELSLAFETDNLIYGRTNNPYNLDRTPGGSSGGEAAIIAACGSPLGVGTDAAGSLRIPAHFCGIATIKPTLGRVPMTGAFPPTLGILGMLFHGGPLARSVEDLALALPVLSGPDGHDPHAQPVSLGSPADVDLGALRVAFFTDNGIATPTAEIQAAVRQAAQVMADAGASVTEARPQGIEETFDLCARLFAADGGAGIQMLLSLAATTEPSRLLLQLGQALHPFGAASPGEFGSLLVRLDAFRSAMLSFMSRYDAIICPPYSGPALPHDASLNDENLPGFSYTMTQNLTGWPAAVAPGGTSPEGLPVGVQVVARPWREDVALAVALRLEAASGGWRAPDL